VQVVSQVEVFSHLMACSYKLPLSLLVSDLMLQYHLPKGKGVKSSWLWCVGSLMMLQDIPVPVPCHDATLSMVQW
jgi:hypothetical protein